MSEQPAGTTGTGPGRCPSCGARVVPGQDWCSLCLEPLGGPQQPTPDEPADDPADSAVPTDAQDHGTGTEPPQGAEPRPGAEPMKTGEPLPPGAAEAMLAELAATSAAERPLSSGPLAGTSRGVRVAIGCGASIVLIGILIALLSLIGLLL